MATDSDGNAARLSVQVAVMNAAETATLALAGLAERTSVPENTPFSAAAPQLDGTPIGTALYSLAGADASHFTVDGTTGAVSLAAQDFEAPVDAGGDNVYEFTLVATDADGNTARQAVAVSVTDVVEARTLVLDGLQAEILLSENTPYLGVAPRLASAPIGNVSYSLTGDDTERFSVEAATGAVFMVARDFEAPADANGDNTYHYTLVATDADSNTARHAVQVRITDLPETAVLKLDGISATARVAENIAYSAAAPTLNGTPIGAVTYTLTGADAALFTVDASTGAVRMVARNFEAPLDTGSNNVYDYTLVATDADGNSASQAVAVTVTDVTVAAPTIVDVTELATDPTPFDLLTADRQPVLTVKADPGSSLRLYTAAGTAVDPSAYTVVETAPGQFSVEVRGLTLDSGRYTVRQVSAAGEVSVDSNPLVVDSTPAVEENTSARWVQSESVVIGALDLIDQNRLNLKGVQESKAPFVWWDADGEGVRLGILGEELGDGFTVHASAASGSQLEVHTARGTYRYFAAPNATLDSFVVTVRDPHGQGGDLTLTFDARDLQDRDGMPSTTEDALARAAFGSTDANGDGIADSGQSSVTTLAWVSATDFQAAATGQLQQVPPTSIASIVVHEDASGRQASSLVQVRDISVPYLDLRPGAPSSGSMPTTGLEGLFTPWDPILFTIESLQSLGLEDIDASRPGVQTRVSLDISAAGLPAGFFNGYVKYVSAEAILAASAAGSTLTTFGGVALERAEQAGWYDFMQKVPGGDGARFIEREGRLLAIELILTDNAFGDNDFSVGRLVDPGMPVIAPATGGSQDPTPVLAVTKVEAQGTTDPKGNTLDIPSVLEGQSLGFSVQLSGASASAQTLSLSLAGTASSDDLGTPAFSSGVIYDPVKQQVTVPAGVSQFRVTVPTLDDRLVESDAETVVLTVSSVSATGALTDNDRPPVITGLAGSTGGSGETLSLAENSLMVGRFTADQPVAWSLAGGADQALFTIDADGRLAWRAAPDFERARDTDGDNVYEVGIRATDSAGNTASQWLSLRITDVQEALPVFGVALGSSDRWLGRQMADVQARQPGAQVTVDFFALPAADAGTLPLRTWVNTLTGDWLHAPEGTTLPYACYVEMPGTDLGHVLPAGRGAFDVHLFINAQGITQTLGLQAAKALGLLEAGYIDLGALFASAAEIGALDEGSVPLTGVPSDGGWGG